MSACAYGVLSLIHFLLELISIDYLSAEEVTFADNFTVAGKLTSILDYWEELIILGPKYGFAKASKSYLIVKEDNLSEARNIFNNSNVNITIEGKRHVGVVTGGSEY